MSLLETGSGSGAISLRSLLAGEQAESPDPNLTVAGLAEEISRGGWPGFRGLALTPALQQVRDYLEEIRRTDISEVDGVRRDPEKVGQLLRSLARNVATHVATTTLAADTGGADAPLKRHTVRDYLDALKRLFIVENQPAWAPHLRSKYVLRRAPKRHFVDPSLAVAALQTSPAALLRDLNLLGLLFESLVIRDLRVYSQPADGRVRQYRDSNDLEVDAIVETVEGKWAAFEIKLGGAALIEEGAANLRNFVRQIDTGKCGEPAALGIIVGTGYGYVREDGIQIIPIGALGP